MISFKLFLQRLDEALTQQQEKLVKSWVSRVKGPLPSEHITGHLPFDENGRLFIPLEKDPSQESHVSPEVEEHLRSKGFTPVSPSHAERETETVIPTGPRAGEKIKKKETQKIGKLLSDKPELQQKHAEETRERGVKGKPKMVVISRNPVDVAGMSTGRKYEPSCMQMADPEGGVLGGCNRHYLEKDITKGGTHVAYLIDHDDVNVENPHARISLHPYVSGSGQHTILRPPKKTSLSDEIKQYGSGGKDFAFTVDKWTKSSLPMKDEEDSYQIHPEVYDDTSLNDVKEKTTLFNPNLSSDGIHRVIARGNVPAIKQLTKSPKFDSSHVTALLSHPNEEVQLQGYSHPLAPKEALDSAMSNPVAWKKHGAVMNNPRATPEHIKAGLNSFMSDVVAAAAKHKSAKEEDLTSALTNNKKINDFAKNAITKRLEQKQKARDILALRNR